MFEFIVILALLPTALYVLFWIIMFLFGTLLVGKDALDNRAKAKRAENEARVDMLIEQGKLKRLKEEMEWGSLSNRSKCSMLLENPNFSNSQKREFFIKWNVPEAKIEELLG